MRALLFYSRLNQLCLITMHKVSADNIFYHFYSLFDSFRVVSSTILTKQILKDVSWHTRIPLYPVSKILPYYSTREKIIQLLIRYTHTNTRLKIIKIIIHQQ